MAYISQEDIARLCESAEAKAWADFCLAAPAHFANKYGIHVERIGSAFAVRVSALDIPLFNRVIGLGLRESATEAMVDTAVRQYQQVGIQNFAIQTTPSAQPTALGSWLRARGLDQTDKWTKVYRSTEPAPHIKSDLNLAFIAKEHAGAFAQIVCRVFELPDFFKEWTSAVVGRPHWYCYLAFDGKQPVGTGAMFVDNGIGWLGFGATLPSHRERGGQSALLAQRIRDAIQFGCRWIVTETGEDTPANPNPSYHNMLRTGFKLAYVRPNYMIRR